jgi:hypothetical protein
MYTKLTVPSENITQISRGPSIFGSYPIQLPSFAKAMESSAAFSALHETLNTNPHARKERYWDFNL